MARTTLETGSNGIQLQLEYGSLVDASTGGSITADTTSVKFSNLEAWIDANGYGIWDATNKLTASGGWVTNGSWSNIGIGSSSSPVTGTKKLKELSPESQPIIFGSTNGSAAVSLSLTGINAAGTLDGSYSRTIPRRPYHAPDTPGVSFADGVVTFTGNQNSASADRYWGSIIMAVEVNDVWSADATLAGSATSFAHATAPNGRYRARASVTNIDGTSGTATSGYFYTAPNTPNGVTATRTLGSTAVSVSWGVNGARYVSMYNVYRSLNGGPYSLVGTSTGTSYADTVAFGSTATYYVVAQSPTGSNTAVSANSATASVNKGWQAPNSHTVVLSRTGGTTGSIKITGNQTLSSGDRYWENLEWAIETGNGVFGGGASGLPGTTTTIPLTGLPADSRISVRARASNSTGGASDWRLSGYIYTTVDAPSDFVAERASAASTTVNLSWTNRASYPGNALLERSVDEVSWEPASTISAGTSSTVTQGVAEAFSYRLRYASPDGAVFSGYSDVQTVGYGFTSMKSKLKIGEDQVDFQYIGETRIRRVMRGTTVVWEDGEP